MGAVVMVTDLDSTEWPWFVVLSPKIQLYVLSSNSIKLGVVVMVTDLESTGWPQIKNPLQNFSKECLNYTNLLFFFINLEMHTVKNMLILDHFS